MAKTSQRTPENFTAADGVTLRDYIEVQFAAMEKANDLAREVNTAQHESLNNFRQAMLDQAKNLLPRSEYEIYHHKVEEDIKALQKYQSTMEGKASQSSVNITLLISIVSLILAFVGIIEKIMVK
jgi:hypothetical protein